MNIISKSLWKESPDAIKFRDKINPFPYPDELYFAGIV